jgi:hypothetical protein
MSHREAERASRPPRRSSHPRRPTLDEARTASSTTPATTPTSTRSAPRSTRPPAGVRRAGGRGRALQGEPRRRERREKILDDNPVARGGRQASGAGRSRVRLLGRTRRSGRSSRTRTSFAVQRATRRPASGSSGTAGENIAAMRATGVQLRDVGTGAFAGLTVPQYLIDLFAPLARAGR